MIKRSTLFSLALFILVSVPAFLSGQDSGASWKAGISRIEITPSQNMWMAGYASRTHPSEGKIHDLWAKALFLEDSNGDTGVLITTDLLGFSKTLSDRIREKLQKEMGLTKAQVILNSSHTHSGPVLAEALTDIYPVDSSEELKIREYSDWLVVQILKLAKQARNSSKEVSIYTGNGVARFQVNRRNNSESKISELTELKGPNDYAVPVMKVENKKGKIEAIVFGYACHPTVLSIYQWSGDYPGFAQLELEKSYEGATAMFFQGAGADQNPLPRRSVPLSKQYGQQLAASVNRVLSEEMKPLEPQMKYAYSEIDLPLEEPPTKEKLVQLTEELKGYQKNWAESLLEKTKKGETLKTSYPYPIQIWQLGDQNIFGLGGELLIGYAINLKKMFGKDSFVMGYSNDVMAYIPTEKVLSEGGYEGYSSHMVYGLPANWKPGIELSITRGIADLAGQLGITPLVSPDELTDGLTPP
ncbi:neutral/alkaline non-lysosomal ceramidase N-terminal domain-containing protein [Mariniphaga sediminis]|uniref:neutral/alkaline non-lysosomal ceramidase N-terminal domain-containing protein n=1 Tax=Mariniphaga sediminis TaxID=1628158 RepID=UPI00356983AB